MPDQSRTYPYPIEIFYICFALGSRSEQINTTGPNISRASAAALQSQTRFADNFRVKKPNELAVLKDEFFKLPANTKLWDQLKSVANWSHEMLPVHEWDGVVFVACVEPNDEIKWSFPVQYVLASADNLNKHWENLNSAEPEAVAAPVIVPDMTEAPEVPEVLDIPDGVPAELSAEAAKTPDVPEGITFNFDTNVDEAPAEEAASEDDIATNPGDAPIGLSEEPPAAPVLNLENLMPVTDEAPVEEETSPKIPNSPPPPSNYDTDASFHEVTRVASVLDILKDDFEGSILLTVEGNELKPLVWDSAWKPQGGAKGPENLNDASAFRVAMRTKHPYLGHVVDTPVNKNFFNAWGINEFPEKILVHPVLTGESIIAVVVCICNPAVKNQVLLSAATRHAKEISKMLLDDSQASAA